ncbi:DUF3137 domain-containing protein [Pedobacter caeni]|uniref:Galanin n=1 Tax=Pedobacter caeni TaxID=288992 RepID=A0A1M5GHL2_9SPHI|nr:DUF3137 domain-containing protein [Pedobacter caeni]SHG03214.1 Protein of unknown function [Pedobacter caeni]
MGLNLNETPDEQIVLQDLAIKNNKELQSVLKELEIERKRLYLLQIQCTLLPLLSLILMVAGPFFLPFPFAFYLLPFITFCYGCSLITKFSEGFTVFKKAHKEKLMIPLLKVIDESITLKPESGISKGDFIDSMLYSIYPDYYGSSDYVQGKIDKTEFYFSEVAAAYDLDPKQKKKAAAPIFKGIVFRADFNKNFKGTTILSADHSRKLIVRNGHYRGATGVYIPTEKIEMENTAFNELFNIRSTDAIEARYLLTPLMMEKLVQLNTGSGGTIGVAFTKNTIYISFPMFFYFFEPQMSKNLLDPKTLHRDLSVVRLMCNVIKELGLNTRIWGKE